MQKEIPQVPHSGARRAAREAGRPEQAADFRFPLTPLPKTQTHSPTSRSLSFLEFRGWIRALGHGDEISTVKFECAHPQENSLRMLAVPRNSAAVTRSVMGLGSQLHDKQTCACSVSSFLGHSPPRAHQGPRSASGLIQPLFGLAGPAFMSGKFSLILHRIKQ